MDEDEGEEDCEDVRGGRAVCYALALFGRGRPGGAEDALFDGACDADGVGLVVGFEELLVELEEDVVDFCAFVGEGDGEEGFEEGDELGGDFGF